MLANKPSGGFKKYRCRRAGPCSLIHQLLSKWGIIIVGFVAGGGSKDG